MAIDKPKEERVFSIKKGGGPYVIDADHGEHYSIRNIHTGHTNIVHKEKLKRFPYEPDLQKVSKVRYKKRRFNSSPFTNHGNKQT